MTPSPSPMEQSDHNPEQQPVSDHDSPWKEALEHYFPDFLELLFPAIHAEIDWQQAPIFLDKELGINGVESMGSESLIFVV